MTSRNKEIKSKIYLNFISIHQQNIERQYIDSHKKTIVS